jgi:peptidoglycan hydrolase CwlO-like protein
MSDERAVSPNYEEMYNDLRKENECLRAELKALHTESKSTSEALDQQTAMVNELQAKVSWYKGQVEAYQYCLNTRR